MANLESKSFNRRSFLRVAVGVAGASLLAACGQQAAPEPTKAPAAAPAAAPTQAPAAPAAAAPTVAAQPAASGSTGGSFDWKKYKGVKMTLALNKHPYTDSLLPLLDQFKTETGMDASFNILPEAEYWRKIELDLSSGGEYDVFMTGPSRNWTFANAGLMEPLDKYVKDTNLTNSDYNFADFFPRLIEGNTWDKTVGGGVGKGSLLAIPCMVETYAMCYRKDIFQEKGLKPPATLDEWYDVAKGSTFKDAQGNQIYGVIARGIRDGSTMATGFMSTFKAYGASDFDQNMKCTINSPQSVEVTAKYAKVLKDFSTPGWTNIQWYEGKESFTNGKYSMYYDCDFFAAGYEDKEKSPVAGKVGYSPTLAPSPDKRVTRYWTWGLGMNSKSKNKEAAWTMLQWATSKQRLLDSTIKYANYNPTRATIFNDPKVQEIMGGWDNGNWLKLVKENLDKYASVAYTPNPEIPFFGTRWAQALQEVWGGKAAQQALDEAAKDIDDHNKTAGILK